MTIYNPIRSAIRSPIFPLLGSRRPLPKYDIANGPTDWYFSQFGLAGTPWADVSRTGLGTRIDAAGAVGNGAHNLLPESESFVAAAPGGTAPPTASTFVDPETGITCLQLVFAVSGSIGYAAGNARVSADHNYVVGQPTSVQIEVWANRNTPVGELQFYSQGANASGGLDYQAPGTTLLANTWNLVTFSFVPANSAATIFVYRTGGPAAETVLRIRRRSVRLVPAAAVGTVTTGAIQNYVPTTTAPVYLPRPTHNPSTLAALGLLVEGQGTNLARRTEEFSSASWVSYETTVTPNTAPGPSGATTADLFSSTAVEDVHRLQMAPTVSNGGQQTVAWRVKAGTHRFCTIGWYGGSNAFVSATFDLLGASVSATETYAGSSSGTITYSRKLVGPNSFVELQLSGSCGGASLTLFICFAPSATGVSVTNFGQPVCPGSVSQNLLLGDVQFETGSVATSYIPNPGTGSAVRVADDWFLSGAAFSNIYNPMEGTLFIACTIPALPSIARLMEITGATPGTHRMLIYTSSTQVLFQVRDSTDQAVLVASVPAVANAEMRIGVTYKANEFRISVNGSPIVEDTAGTVPSGMNSLSLGWAQSGPNDRAAQTVIRAARYIPAALSGAALQALTA